MSKIGENVKIDTTSGDIDGAMEEIRSNASYFQIITRDYKVSG